MLLAHEEGAQAAIKRIANSIPHATFEVGTLAEVKDESSARCCKFCAGAARAKYPENRRAALALPVSAPSTLTVNTTNELLVRKFSIALDCHSGFGFGDRIWFPYAHKPEPIRHLAEVHALQEIYLQAYSHHQYLFEPQSLQYLAHGDLWDHMYLRAGGNPDRVFLPLTLEMGSWSWVRKNPKQLFSRSGIFNPLIAHRHQRVLRRHMAFLDFLGRAACGHALWTPTEAGRAQRHADAVRHWYGREL